MYDTQSYTNAIINKCIQSGDYYFIVKLFRGII